MTLVDLLVSLAIMSNMFGLLLCAVQRVRETANASKCRNNLKQMGLAMHSHHDVHTHLPYGMLRIPNAVPVLPVPVPQVPPVPATWVGYWPWHVELLPFIEQDAAFTAFNRGMYSWHQSTSSQSIPLYKCPSDSRADVRYPLSNHEVACTGYLGVSGTNQFAFDGLLYVNSRVPFHHVVDGLSNTLLIGERPPSSRGWWGWWAGGTGDWPNFGSADNLLGAAERVEPTAPPEVFRAGELRDPLDLHRRHFWSMHLGGAHFVWGDGHVSFLRYGDIQNFATRQSGDN